ncbi:WG repeat-containing protein [Longispora albida]|uniref:WG repeat-containing protein n=1 Tax=Longispora albida TaxID=203523 RepID=UPI000381EAD8|nr:WG repeat-containing protein [Longispora albida]
MSETDVAGGWFAVRPAQPAPESDAPADTETPAQTAVQPPQPAQPDTSEPEEPAPFTFGEPPQLPSGLSWSWATPATPAEPAPQPESAPEPEPDPVPVPAPRLAEYPSEPLTGDPERTLAAIRFDLDPDTLREIVADPGLIRSVRDALTERLTEAGDAGVRARLLGLRAVCRRLLGDLDSALSDAKMALAQAELTGQLRRIALSRARLARVHQWREEHAEADELYAKANSSELPAPLRASLYAHASRSALEQGHLVEAANLLERALELRRLTFDQEFVTEVETALDAIAARAERSGFGPVPEAADPPEQRMPEGDYFDAQPYRDDRAWVRHTEDDEWVAIDGEGRTVIAAGYDDVRPFRHGVAIVRRAGGWGAVDVHGKVVLSCSYDQFCTALADGRYVDGFTEEGLAVVERGGRKGVVDRQGKVLLQPAYRGLVIHPVAYLVVSAEHRWGALDRRGEEIIEPVFASRAEVIEHVERLLSDARPVI